MIDGRRFHFLAIADDFTRECLALVADTSLPALRVVRELDALIADQLGDPALVTGLAGRVAPHRSWQAAAEGFRGELQWAAARRVAERDAVQLARSCPRGLSLWKDDYNTIRPHSGLDNLTPAAYAKISDPAMQRDGTLR